MFGTRFTRWMYLRIAKPYFFKRDPEDVHDFVCGIGHSLGKYRLSRFLLSWLFRYERPELEQVILGMKFANPVGLTAGFDKNAQLTDIMPSIGFGFAEIGSVTGERCEGNPKPRLWRLPKSQGLLVWYGLKNDGCVAVAERLRKKKFEFPVGTNIARTNSPTTTDRESGIRDYEKAFSAFSAIGSYMTINISCPNTCGGELFTIPSNLDHLLTRLDLIPTTKPIFIKLPADISIQELDALVDVVEKHRVHGFIVSNLTKALDQCPVSQDELQGMRKGGISGRPLCEKANELISILYRRVKKKYVIIGSGGIFSASDAYEKICRGASLVQLATGMIFEGPQLIGEINQGLTALLKRDGFSNISQAIGAKTRSES